jgi:hypothetical protein
VEYVKWSLTEYYIWYRSQVRPARLTLGADATIGGTRIGTLGNVFRLFGRSSRRGPRPPRGPGGTVRQADRNYLRQWTAQRRGVEAFIEPETLVNEMSVVLVDDTGDWTRRRIGGPKGVDVIIQDLGVRVYDAEKTGYPQRMRDRLERDRIIRKRLEAQERRERFEERTRRESDGGSSD